MRYAPGPIWDAWLAGGPFIGDAAAPNAYVTVEPDWYLTKTAETVGNYSKGPIRWWQRADNSQVEVEIPNVKSIEIERSIESDAAGATITLRNQKMNANVPAPGVDRGELGNPGYFTWNRGQAPEARQRWRHTTNEWFQVLVPNALIRTYQGYGGRHKTRAQAIADGNVMLTGVWMVDDVKVSSNGSLVITCRDPAKLLIEQIAFPPLIPEAFYPLRYCRWQYRKVMVPGGEYPAQIAYRTSSGDYWYGHNANIHGHRPTDSLDGNPHSFALSVGNSHPSRPFCTDYFEYETFGQEINGIWLHPWAGNYHMYVSVMENGVWQGGAGNIPYDFRPLCPTQRCIDTRADIPCVLQAGVPWERGQTYRLPRMYRAQRIRVTFRNHTHTQWGPWRYRCGIREIGARKVVDPYEKTVKEDGNFKDWTDIVKELLLWGGYFLHENVAANAPPRVYGNLESTGAYPEECVGEDFFDKRPLIDPITQIKEIVGYIFFVDDEGAARFESPNWWMSGNFLPNGRHTHQIPELDERIALTNYTAGFADKGASEIIVSSNKPDVNGRFTTTTTRYRPPTASLLRGMERPFGWTNGVLEKASEQRIMAELVAMHIYFAQRQGQVTIAANPGISINDQVRIIERTTAETFLHYVRGVSSHMDLDSGSYTMDLTTHWLGDAEGNWVITRDNIPTGQMNRFQVSEALEDYWNRAQARAIAVARPVLFRTEEFTLKETPAPDPGVDAAATP